jgi:hypothetical protein
MLLAGLLAKRPALAKTAGTGWPDQLTSTRRLRDPSCQIAVCARQVARNDNNIPVGLDKLCCSNLFHDMQVMRQMWRPTIALSLALVATACGSGDHRATGQSSPTTRSTVTIARIQEMPPGFDDQGSGTALLNGRVLDQKVRSCSTM